MKLLALVNAHALAHVSRPLQIAKVLRKRGHEIVFAGHGKYLEIATSNGFDTVDLPFVPVGQMVEAVKSHKLFNIYKESQLAEFVQAELNLYELTSPDLVLIDNRLTASTSAELAGLRSISILNVHMSIYKDIPYYSLRNALSLRPSRALDLLDRVENRIECFFYDKVVMTGMNNVRKNYGLVKKYGYELEEGDLTLFPDIPEFSPVSGIPENARYIGPLTWHNDLSAPACLSKLDPSKPCLYLTLGSEGLEGLLEKINIISDKGVQVVVATGQLSREMDIPLSQSVFIEKYVNTDTLLPHCDLVVCHGGNGTIYQALSHGLPIVGVATHEEQYYGLKRVNQLELGIGFSEKILKNRGWDFLVDRIDDVLSNKTYKTNAEGFQSILRNWNGEELGANIIERYATSSVRKK